MKKSIADSYGTDNESGSETPEEKMGDVMGDLNSRRGIIQGMSDMVGGSKSVDANVPLAELFGYATPIALIDARAGNLSHGI